MKIRKGLAGQELQITHFSSKRETAGRFLKVSSEITHPAFSEVIVANR